MLLIHEIKMECGKGAAECGKAREQAGRRNRTASATSYQVVSNLLKTPEVSPDQEVSANFGLI